MGQARNAGVPVPQVLLVAAIPAVDASGLIDFGMFGGGSPVGDFAYMNCALRPSDVDATLRRL
jgi:aminoglycoside phosphotransferase (APT) family kinase protein